MQPWLDGVMVMLILTNLALLGSSRMVGCIRLVALQGAALGALPLLAGEALTGRLAALSVITIGIKAVIFPRLLLRAVRQANIRREVEPFVGYIGSVIVGLFSLAGAVWLGARLPGTQEVASALVPPVALFMIFVGLFIIISRRKALSQIMGYIVMENGMYAFGVVMLEEIPLLVELGILLDAFVAIFVMGVAIYHIRREFDHIDVDQLDTLKG